MYKLLPQYLGEDVKIVQRLSDNAFIPFTSDNTDYQKFKYDAEHGAVVQDATGRSMTAQEITTLLGTLP